MNIAHILAVVSIFLVSTSCGDDNGSKPRRFSSAITVDGIARHYMLNLPPQYNDDSKVPLVVVLHGFGGQGSQAEIDYGWSKKGDQNNFAVVYPDGTQNTGRFSLRSWNAGTCCHYALEENIDDVRFITTLIEELIEKYPIDASRVYVAGMSNGGMMTYRLACERSDLIAAVASVSGPFLPKTPCDPVRPIPALHIHSRLDEKIPFEGGIGLGSYYYPPVDSGLTVLREHNACQKYEEQIVSGKYTFRRWSECSGNADIESYLVDDGGHSWPGGLIPRQGADAPSTAIDATDVIWDFFVTHPLP